MLEDANWDADFNFSSLSSNYQKLDVRAPTVVLSGIATDINQEEDWDDDFDQSKAEGNSYLFDITKSSLYRSSVIAAQKEKVNHGSTNQKLFSALNFMLIKLAECRVSSEDFVVESTEKHMIHDFKACMDYSARDSEQQRLLYADFTRLKNSGLWVEAGNMAWQLGLLSKSHGSAVDAISYFETANSIFTDLEKDQTQRKLLNYDTALIYYQLGLTARIVQDMAQAVNCFKCSIKNAAVYKNQEALIGSYFHMGHCLLKLNELLKAIDYHYTFLCLIIDPQYRGYFQPSNASCMIEVFCDIAQCSYLLKQKDLAFLYLEHAILNYKDHKETIFERTSTFLDKSEVQRLLDGDGTGLKNKTLPNQTEDELKSCEVLIASLRSNAYAGKKSSPPYQKDSYNDADVSENESWADISSSRGSEINLLKSQLLLEENIEQSQLDEVAPFRILREIDSNVMTVKYPKPSTLYSANTERHVGHMSETEFDGWLTNVVMKYKKPFYNLYVATESNKNLLLKIDPVNASPTTRNNWCVDWLLFCSRPLYNQNLNGCRECIASYIKQMKPYFRTCLETDSALLRTTRIITFIGAQVWDSHIENQFICIAEAVSKLSPLYFEVHVLICETHVHHNYESYLAVQRLIKIYQDVIQLSSSDVAEQHLDSLNDLQARILADFHLYLSDRSMLTTEVQTNIEDENFDQIPDHFLLDDVLRMDILIELYPRLKLSETKAKAALALGLYFQDIKNDYVQAERLFFEALKNLDDLTILEEMYIPIITGFGSSCLTCYAVVLDANQKFRYAIAALNAALLSFNMKKETTEYYACLHQAARIAQRQGDLSLSAEYYSEICQDYEQSQRVNEAVYTNERLCSMYIEVGNLDYAINTVKKALSIFSYSSGFSDKSLGLLSKVIYLDSTYLCLQLQAAYILLHSYHWKDGLHHLRHFERLSLPNSVRLIVYELLIRAYIKIRTFREADHWIEAWRNLQKKKIQRTKDFTRYVIATSCTFPSDYDLAYYEFKARNYFHWKKLDLALEFIDRAIAATLPTRYNYLGRQYCLKGRILKQLFKDANYSGWSSHVDNSFFKHASSASASTYSNFEKPIDFFWECLATYRQSYKFYKLVGDDWRISRVTTDIAEVYLEYLFWPVASEESLLDELLAVSFVKKPSTSLKSKNQPFRDVIDTAHGSPGNSEISKEFEKPPFAQSTGKHEKYATYNLEGTSLQKRALNLKHSVTQRSNVIQDELAQIPPDFSAAPQHRFRSSSVQADSCISHECIPSLEYQEMRKHLELSEPKAPSSSQHLAQHAYLEQGSASEHAFDTLSDTIPTEDHSSSSFIQISSIENAAKLGLELAVNSGDLMLIFNGYLNMAELRFLQGRIASSVSFWQEFRLQFTNYFLVSSRVILRNAPAHFLEKQYLLVKRALRFLFFMPRSMVNKNLDFIDVLLLLERDFELQLQLLTDDLSVGDSSPDLHDDNTSKQQHQSEDLSQEERREHVLSKIASSIWGLLYYMKRQQHRYSEGKMMFEELRTISTDCIYKLLYLAEISRSSNPEAMINQIKNLSSNHSKRASRMLMFPPPSSSIETSGSSYLWSELEPDFKIRCEQFFLSADRQSVQTYETLMDSTNNKLTNLVYIIQLDSLIFHYVPLTGDYRIQRIGFEKSPVQPRLDNDNVILLKIHLLDQQQEFVTLSVPAYYTLNRVLDYLLDINNGNDALPIEQKPLKKRGFLGSWLHASSRNASSSSTKYSRITKVDKSPHFFSKFWQLLSFLNNTDELKSDADTQRTFTNSGQTASHRRSSTPFYKRPGFLEKQPSSIGAALKSLIILASFKARTHLESDTWIHPLSNKMHKRISDCFTKHEISHSLKAPVNLFLYLSTHVMLSGGCTTQVKLTCISREILSFLHQLLGVPCKETPIDTILCEFQQLFSPLIQILPVKHSETSLTQRLFQTSGLASLKESGSFSGQHTSPPSSSASPERTAFDANEDQTSSVQFPVILVSTRYMSSIPWELFLPCQPLVRYFLLRDAITSYIKSALHNSFSPTQPKDECAPQKTPFVFLNLYISKPFRHLLSKEVVRRNKLIQSLDNHLCASFQCCRVDYSSNDSPLFPFSTPIVLDPKMITSYKQKYKYIKFVDVSAYYPSIQSIFNLCAPSNHPVFLCSYSDLLETNYSIYQLTNNPNMLSTFIFIPNSKFKPIVHNLVSLYDPDTSNLKYPSTDGNRDYTNLTTLLNSLAVKHKTPIVCVNPFDM